MPGVPAGRSCVRNLLTHDRIALLPTMPLARRLQSFLVGLVFTLALAVPAGAGTIDDIRNRGTLVCGVTEEAFGYSWRDPKGEWSGLAADLCRGLAIAILGKRDAVEFREAKPATRFGLLQSGAIDILSTDIALTATRDTSLGLRFPGVLAYGGQGFLVRRAHGVTSALELSGARVCVTAASGDEQGVMDYFAALKLPVEVVKIEGWKETVTAYGQKTCPVLSASNARLAAARAALGDTSAHVVLPELAARHAYGPAIRQGDEAWFSAVRWVMQALVAAEDLGVTAANAEQLKTTGSAEVRRLLGNGSELWAHIGLAVDWPLQVVKNLGNFGELYERHLGARSQLKIERGKNNLTAKGGLHFALPFQ